MSEPVMTVFIVDDDEDVSQSIAFLVESVGLQSKIFLTAGDFINAYQGQPGCLVLDVRMPKMSGLELQRHMADQGSSLPIIFLTGHGDVPMAVQAMKLGALNFMSKPFSGQMLLDNIHEALKHDKDSRAKQAGQENILNRIHRLTEREKQIMQLVIQGKRSREIGKLLGISAKTVELHRNKIIEKMEVSSSVELATLVAGVEEMVI